MSERAYVSPQPSTVLHASTPPARVRCLSPAGWVRHIAAALSSVPAGRPATLTYAHPCRIDGAPHLVYERGLRERDPAAFGELERFAQAHGYRLREDRRRQDVQPAHERRQPWVEVLLLTLGLAAGSALAGERAELLPIRFAAVPEKPDARTAVRPFAGADRHLVPGTAPPGMRDGHRQAPEGATQSPPVDPADNAASPPAAEASELRGILLAHYEGEGADPAYIPSDLERMADYYARFPEVVGLLRSLKDAPWRLAYQPRTWTTQARGTAVRVRAVRIAFDTRIGALLGSDARAAGGPACRVSPADALLHELLHARAMLLEPSRFLAQGGLSGALYSHAHETAVIGEEKILYRQMTGRDGIERPQRSSHAGRLVQAACSLCVR